jgi:hypothetical protein
LVDLLDILKKIQDAGASFRSLGETFETESPAGRMMMNMLGCFAQFEREIIVERIKRGLEHARANGKIGGGRYKLSPDDQREAIRLIQVEKKSQGQVAHIYKVDRSTISRMMTEVRLKQDLKGGCCDEGFTDLVGNRACARSYGRLVYAPPSNKMITFKTISSVSEAIDSIQQWQRSEDLHEGHIRFWFRGQAKEEWPLIPKLFRMFKKSDEQTILDAERQMVRDFRLMSYSIRDGRETPEDLYFLQQHYGMPTRLLDWTTNPLVALFFACQSELSGGNEANGKLFVLDALTLTGLWPEPDGMPFGIATDQQPEFRDWVQTIVGGDWQVKGPLINKPFPVLPKHFDRRITLQKAAFTFHPSREPLDRSIYYFPVKADAKERIRLQLRTLNIHRFGIFGDLQSLSEHLQDIHAFRAGFGYGRRRVRKKEWLLRNREVPNQTRTEDPITAGESAVQMPLLLYSRQQSTGNIFAPCPCEHLRNGKAIAF